MARSASVKDVAAAAGVSLGTVSNVLNRPDRVSPDTRERVLRAMADLGFVRNESARQLRAGSSRTLAYVMLDASNPFFTDVAQGIDTAAEAADLSLVLCNSRNSGDREQAHLALLEQQRVQGILVTPVDPDSASLDEVARRGTPVVVVDRTRADQSFCSVAVDDVLGGRLAIEHLVDRGHTRVAYIGGPPGLGQVEDRWRGAQEAWAALGRPTCRSRPAHDHGPVGRRGSRGRPAPGRAARPPPTDGRVLRQRPGRARPAPAGDRLRDQGSRGAGDRRLRRHRVRRGGRRTPHLGAAAPPAARAYGRGAGARRGDQRRAHPPAGALHPRARRPGVDVGLAA